MISLLDCHRQISACMPALDVLDRLIKSLFGDIVAAVDAEPLLDVVIALAVCPPADILITVGGGIRSSQRLDNHRVHL